MIFSENRLKTFFVFIMIVCFFLSFIVTIERYIVEQKRVTISLGTDLTQFLISINRDKNNFEKSITDLLSSGIDSFSISSFSLEELEKFGKISIIRREELSKLKSIDKIFPDFFINVNSLIPEDKLYDYYITSKDETVIKKIYNSLRIIYSDSMMVKQFSCKDKIFGLKIDSYDPYFLRNGIYFDIDRYRILKKMGFKLYYRFSNFVDIITEMNGRLSKSIRDKVISGIIIDGKNSFDIGKIESFIKKDFLGKIILLNLEKKMSPLKFSKKMKEIASKIVEGVTYNITKEKIRNIPINYGSIKYIELLLPTNKFLKFIIKSKKLTEEIRKAGYNIGGNSSLYIENKIVPVVVVSILFLTIAVYFLFGFGYSNLIIFLFYILMNILLIPFIYYMNKIGLISIIRYFEGIPILFFLVYFPFFIETIFKFNLKERYDLLIACFIYIVISFLHFFLISSLIFSLYYSPFFLNIDFIYSNKIAFIIFFTFFTCLYPIFNGRLRNRFLKRIAYTEVRFIDLFLIIIGVITYYFALKLSNYTTIYGINSYWYSCEEWLIGVPALFLFFYLRLKKRIRYSWITFPFFIFLTAGLGIDLLYNSSISIYLKFLHTIRTFILGTSTFLVYYIIYKKILNSLDKNK